jgi:hypothetical protein
MEPSIIKKNAPSGSLKQFQMRLKRLLICEPFPTSKEIHERLDKVRALAVFASDPISSYDYATEAIMGILVVLGSAALALTLPIALGIAALVLLVIFSYIQTILHYPEGVGPTPSPRIIWALYLPYLPVQPC